MVVNWILESFLQIVGNFTPRAIPIPPIISDFKFALPSLEKKIYNITFSVEKKKVKTN